jgi:hypothetical protein
MQRPFWRGAGPRLFGPRTVATHSPRRAAIGCAGRGWRVGVPGQTAGPTSEVARRARASLSPGPGPVPAAPAGCSTAATPTAATAPARRAASSTSGSSVPPWTCPSNAAAGGAASRTTASSAPDPGLRTASPLPVHPRGGGSDHVAPLVPWPLPGDPGVHPPSRCLRPPTTGGVSRRGRFARRNTLPTAARADESSARPGVVDRVPGVQVGERLVGGLPVGRHRIRGRQSRDMRPEPRRQPIRRLFQLRRSSLRPAFPSFPLTPRRCQRARAGRRRARDRIQVTWSSDGVPGISTSRTTVIVVPGRWQLASRCGASGAEHRRASTRLCRRHPLLPPQCSCDTDARAATAAGVTTGNRTRGR